MRSTVGLLAGLSLLGVLGMTSLSPPNLDTTPGHASIGVPSGGRATVAPAMGLIPLNPVGQNAIATAPGCATAGHGGTLGPREIPAVFNGVADFSYDAYGYYAVLTGGLFPACQVTAGYTGDNASGGTMRFINDDPEWGYPTAFQTWARDDWFDTTSAVALTMKNGGGIVFDNNGIESGTYPVNFYGNPADPSEIHPGLYCGFSMSNNFDWIYSGYFCLDAETTIDEIIGYFPETYYSTIAPHLGTGVHKFRMNIWSKYQDGPHPMPIVDSFIGDVFSSDLTAGAFSYSNTGVVRHYSGFSDNDDIIYRLTFTPDAPLVLPAGEYFFSHDAQLDPGKLTLEVDGPCPDDADGLAGHQIAVELWMRDLVEEASGFQAFLEFDPAKLQFEFGTYTSTPFSEHIPVTIAAVGSAIDLASATSEAQLPTAGDALLATLIFTVLDECESTAITFREPAGPFVSELSSDGVPVLTALHNSSDFDLDDTPPTIDVCPAVTVVECDGAGNTASLNAWLASFAASDNCGTVTLTDDFTALSDDCGATGSATVTFTATDPCGNETSCTSTFTIEDTTAPSIDTPADHLTVECDGFGNTAELTAWLDSHGGAAASDDCGGVAWSHDFSALSDDCCATGSATVTFTATDDCGLTSTTTATFTIEDTTSPVVSGCPADIVVNADAGECTAVVTWTPPTATDVCCDDGLEVSVVSTHNPGDVFGLGLTTVTYTFEDDCGNTEICEFTVTVQDVNDVTATVILEGVDLDAPGVVLPVQRCIKFIAKNGTTCAEPVHVMVTFDTEDGTSGWAMGTAEFDVECGLWTELCAKDEQHTLYDTQDLTDLGTEYLAAADLYLMAGDTDNDSDVDIHDVTWLMYQWRSGGTVSPGGCPWDGTRDADFNLNEFAGLSSDYLLLSNNWHLWTTCACTALATGGSSATSIVTVLDAAHLPAEVARTVDLNNDGLIDHLDVRAFEVEFGLPNQLSARMAPQAKEAPLISGLRRH